MSTSPLARRIEALRAIQSRVEEFVAAFADQPDLSRADVAAELRSVADTLDGGDGVPPVGSTSPVKVLATASVRERLLAVFRTNGNAPTAVRELARLTNASEATVSTTLIGRAEGQFERCGQQPGKKGMVNLWRATESGLRGDG